MLSAENYDISSMETIAVVANRESSCDEELGSARVEIAGGKETISSNGESLGISRAACRSNSIKNQSYKFTYAIA
jgi:hypothetical protein